MDLAHWFHHLFNPHCILCLEQAIEKKVCQSCETLREQLAIANYEKKQLLASILEKPSAEPSSPQVDYEKIKPKVMTWNVRKQLLEAEDKKQAQVIADQKKAAAEAKGANDRAEEISKLEKELGINEEVKTHA